MPSLVGSEMCIRDSLLITITYIHFFSSSPLFTLIHESTMSLTDGHPLATQLHTQHCLVPPGTPPLQQSFSFRFPPPRSSDLALRRHWRTIPPVSVFPPHHLLPKCRPHAQTGPGGFLQRHPPGHIRAGGSLTTRDMNGHGGVSHILRQRRRGRIDCPFPHSHRSTRPTRNKGRRRLGVQVIYCLLYTSPSPRD